MTGYKVVEVADLSRLDEVTSYQPDIQDMGSLSKRCIFFNIPFWSGFMHFESGSMLQS